jgi:hypothetical protein
MNRNVGTIDRFLRAALVAPAAVVGALAAGAGSVLGIILLVVAAVMLATAVVGFCPLYRLLGISTRQGRTHASL